MTNEQIRIAIAKECGLKNPRQHLGTLVHGDSLLGGCMIAAVPDYPTDLNAMHEAEKMLTETQWSTYGDLLIQHIKPYSGPGLWNHRHIHATARQRAEAFLHTIGKWEDE